MHNIMSYLSYDFAYNYFNWIMSSWLTNIYYPEFMMSEDKPQSQDTFGNELDHEMLSNSIYTHCQTTTQVIVVGNVEEWTRIFL